MSADNWTVCPRCKAKNDAAREAHAKTIRAAYGKVTVDEWEKLKTSVPPPEPEDTLREDYEIGIRRGEFFAAYFASCNECGFTFEFKHKQETK